MVERTDKIYENVYMTGYLSPTKFGKNFLKKFGMTSTDYLTMKQVKNSSHTPAE